jgi:hypothetical protein
MVPFAPALSLASAGRFELIASPHYKRPVIPGRKGVLFYPACFREFSHITWPESLDLPWVHKPETQSTQEASHRDIDRELTIKCGPAYTITEKGSVIINQNYFVQRFCLENLVIFEQDENQFYIYCKKDGAWQKAVPEIIKEKMRSDWERLTHSFDEPSLAFKIGDNLLNSLASERYQGSLGSHESLQAAQAHHPL